MHLGLDTDDWQHAWLCARVLGVPQTHAGYPPVAAGHHSTAQLALADVSRSSFFFVAFPLLATSEPQRVVRCLWALPFSLVQVALVNLPVVLFSAPHRPCPPPPPSR